MSEKQPPSIQPSKRDTIERILDNPTYTPESGIVKRLAVALAHMSADNLDNLELVIKTKVVAAIDDGLQPSWVGRPRMNHTAPDVDPDEPYDPLVHAMPPTPGPRRLIHGVRSRRDGIFDIPTAPECGPWRTEDAAKEYARVRNSGYQHDTALKAALADFPRDYMGDPD